jgi:hypothetical protein
MIDLFKRIKNRRQAYRRCFIGDDGLLTKDAEIVIADLVEFCRWYKHQTIVSPLSKTTDVPASFQAIGRREVFARIMVHLNTSDADLTRITEGVINE